MTLRNRLLLFALLIVCWVPAFAQTLTYNLTVSPSDLKSGDALQWVFTESGNSFSDMSTYKFSSSCPQIMSFGVTNNYSNIILFWWFDDSSPWLAFDERTLCTFNVTKDGGIVATASATFEATPQDNMGPQDCCAGEPIDLASGNTYIQQTDISIPGLNGGLQLVRTWNSLFSTFHGDDVANGLFGNNWRCNYEERVVGEDGGIAHYWRGDGNIWTFKSGNDPSHYTLAQPANTIVTLDRSALFWTLVFKNGERRIFSGVTGALEAIQDRNGNTTSISHDSLGRILTVTDPASRHLFFHYALADSFDSQFNTAVTSVTSDVGISMAYGYTNQLDFIVTNNVMLSRVTYPDQSTIGFGYVFSPDFRSTLIKTVVDSAGKVLETHTYDRRNRGLTSSKANGVESLTVTYPQ